MDFFKQIVLPASPEFLNLLDYVQILAYLLYFPFLSMLTGGTLSSLIIGSHGVKNGKEDYIRFGKDVMEKLTVSKGAAIAFIILPLLSVIFGVTQILYGSNSDSIILLLISFIFFLIGIIYVYRYKNSIQYFHVTDSIKLQNFRAGWTGLIYLFGGMFFYGASMYLIETAETGKNLLGLIEVIYSWQSWINFIYLFSFSMLVTAGAILFFFFSWGGGIKKISGDYNMLIRIYTMSLSIIFSSLWILIMFIKFVNLPQAVISNSVYTFTFLTLFSIFLICGLTYAIYRSNKVAIAALVFPLVILVIFFNIFNQQQILAKSYQDQIKQTNNDAAILEKEKLSKVVVTSNVNAEEIYNTKCSSCHKFDQKLVGPAHKDVIPKYNGDVSKLSSFIQNPVKIDPAYPPMPSLGITKKEADALANYLIGKVVSK